MNRRVCAPLGIEPRQQREQSSRRLRDYDSRRYARGEFGELRGDEHDSWRTLRQHGCVAAVGEKTEIVRLCTRQGSDAVDT